MMMVARGCDLPTLATSIRRLWLVLAAVNASLVVQRTTTPPPPRPLPTSRRDAAMRRSLLVAVPVGGHSGRLRVTRTDEGTPTNQDPPPDSGRGAKMTPATAAAMAVAVSCACLVIAGAALCFYLYYRRRRQEREGRIYGYRQDGSWKAWIRLADEPPRAQPLYDGLAGYDDGPTSGSDGEPHLGSRAREELEAARLRSQSLPPPIVSYGPNPVGRAAPLETSGALDRSPRSVSPDSRDESMYMPSSIKRHDGTMSASSQSPWIVSYGPNPITPTPIVSKNTTVAVEDTMINQIPDHPAVPTAPDPDKASVSTSPLPTLPPYASPADLSTMTQGAIRPMPPPPPATAELPPTKDGYYPLAYDGSDEHELPGAAPQREPQLPHRLYGYQEPWSQLGDRGSTRARRREVEEQKVLLDDLDLTDLKRVAAARDGQPTSDS
ncbi:hypothetical protein VTK73DRAFT_9179 [Phialemonium thermophilum]|uniref:Uncharacterized protein n=1 Tax=Phialemonium thermophilum TaxID=223376 RepID=A0ABR3W3W3_9PEZI